MKKLYVDGFLFDDEGNNVLLIRKTRPEWQAGFLNGIGGKVEEYELPIDAMCREFAEETGIAFDQWEHTIQHDDPDWTVFYYRAYSTPIVNTVINQKHFPTDEIPIVYQVSNLGQCVRNIKWAIPLSNDRTVIFPVVIEDSNSV